MSRRHIHILFIGFMLTFQLTAQTDTVIHQSHLTESIVKGKKQFYRVDKREATKAEYDEAKVQSSNITGCKPCWLKVLDKKGDVTYEGDFYQDCCIGAYMERYSSGQLKVKGQCKPDKTACFTKQGEWIYYKANGVVEKTEMYKDGILVK